MALAITRDVTNDFNTNQSVVVDISGWDWGVVQIVTNSGTINFTSTNDGGGVQGTSYGDASSATNFMSALLTNVATGATATSLANGSGAAFRFEKVGQYIKFAGTSTVVKLLIFLSKIS